jgi:hypothetical protein
MLTAYFSLKLSRLSLSTKEQKSLYNINPKLSQKKNRFSPRGQKKKIFWPDEKNLTRGTKREISPLSCILSQESAKEGKRVLLEKNSALYETHFTCVLPPIYRITAFVGCCRESSS